MTDSVVKTLCDLVEDFANQVEALEKMVEACKADAVDAEAYADELAAKLAKAMQVVEMIASADVDAVLGEAVDLSCEIIGELMEDEDDA